MYGDELKEKTGSFVLINTTNISNILIVVW